MKHSTPLQTHLIFMPTHSINTYMQTNLETGRGPLLASVRQTLDTIASVACGAGTAPVVRGVSALETLHSVVAGFSSARVALAEPSVALEAWRAGAADRAVGSVSAIDAGETGWGNVGALGTLNLTGFTFLKSIFAVIWKTMLHGPLKNT